MSFINSPLAVITKKYTFFIKEILTNTLITNQDDTNANRYFYNKLNNCLVLWRLKELNIQRGRGRSIPSKITKIILTCDRLLKYLKHR